MELKLNNSHNPRFEKKTMPIMALLGQGLFFSVYLFLALEGGTDEDFRSLVVIILAHVGLSYALYSYYFKFVLSFSLTPDGLKMQRGVFSKKDYEYKLSEIQSMKSVRLGFFYGDSLLIIKTPNKTHYIFMLTRFTIIDSNIPYTAAFANQKRKFEAETVADAIRYLKLNQGRIPEDFNEPLQRRYVSPPESKKKRITLGVISLLLLILVQWMRVYWNNRPEERRPPVKRAKSLDEVPELTLPSGNHGLFLHDRK